MEKPYVSLLGELFCSSLHGAHLTEEQLRESSENWAQKEDQILSILRNPVKSGVVEEDTHVPHA